MSLSIDASRCQGHGRCSLISPKLFDVTDDGLGNPVPPALTGGQGLAGMRERVAVFGGDLRAGPRPGGGFTVYARLPIGEPS